LYDTTGMSISQLLNISYFIISKYTQNREIHQCGNNCRVIKRQNYVVITRGLINCKNVIA